MHPAQATKVTRTHAFSLIELLVVIAIISLLTTLTIPAVGSINSASKRTQFLSTFSNVLETARQYAVANNTYVWVAFGEKDNNLYTATVSSRSGLSQGYGPAEIWNNQTINLQNADDFSLISRVVKLGEYTISSAPADFSSQPGFQTTAGGTGSLLLSRSVQFSPSGEARVAPGLRGDMVFAAKAVQGQFADREEKIVVNGLTGFVSVQGDD